MVPFFLVLGVSLSALVYAVIAHASEATGAGPSLRQRLASLLTFAVLDGLVAAGVVGLVLGFDEDTLLLATVCATLALAVASVTVALQEVAGTAGSGLAALFVVILGVACSGALAGPWVLPDGFRALAPILPAGVGLAAVRGTLVLRRGRSRPAAPDPGRVGRRLARDRCRGRPVAGSPCRTLDARRGGRLTPPASRPQTRRSGRRPGSSGTRQAILVAARHQFVAAGFGGSSIRSIAAEAGVDPSLVIHYFGSKDSLLGAVMAWPIDLDEIAEQVVAPGPEGVGERLVRFFLAQWDDPSKRHPLTVIVRNAVSHGRRPACSPSSSAGSWSARSCPSWARRRRSCGGASWPAPSWAWR